MPSIRWTRYSRTHSQTATESCRIDLRGLEFIDSTGIRLLLTAHQRALRKGHELRIIRGSDRIQRIFALTDLEARLPFCEDET